jgi:Ser/Thr protein kinase RdoA (MazF antagonist)
MYHEMTKNMGANLDSSSFYSLDPERVLFAAESLGYFPTGELTQLNSYENRVFDIALETNDPRLQRDSHIIAKFYRPHRWSNEGILEEHDFLADLQDEGVKAVAPLKNKDDYTLFHLKDLRFTFFPKVLGRMPQELLEQDLVKVGRLLARVHNVGAKRIAEHRPVLDDNYFGGWPALEWLESWVAQEVSHRYFEAAEYILEYLGSQMNHSEFIRIHGDCHRGNLLQSGSGEFFLVDFDDCMSGPVIQDFWMLLSGDKESFDKERELLLTGYEELRSFPHHQWDLIPALRGLRIISYAAWIAKRWKDPSFPRLFPEFNTYRYWAEETEALEKIAWELDRS